VAAPITVSWSEINNYRSCPHKHELEYTQRWQRPNNPHSALGRGTFVHKVLEVYYTSLLTGKDIETAYRDARREIGDYRGLGFDRETCDLVEWILEGYHEKWSTEDSLKWKVVAVEHRFQVPLLTAGGRKSRFILKGGIDLIVRDQRGRLIIIDHKTCAVLPDDQSYEMSDQFGLYLWAMRQLGHKIFAGIHNALKTKRNKGDFPENVEMWETVKAEGGKPGARPVPQELDARFARTWLARTDRELTTIALEAMQTAQKMHNASLPKERNPDDMKCKRMCSFRDACIIGRRQGPEKELHFLKEVGFVQNFARHLGEPSNPNSLL
jgi:hypothetical protein